VLVGDGIEVVKPVEPEPEPVSLDVADVGVVILVGKSEDVLLVVGETVVLVDEAALGSVNLNCGDAIPPPS
jgi:hypothetical protein